MKIGNIIIAGAAALIVSGFVYYKLQIKKLSDIKTKPVRYRFRNFSLSNATLEVDIMVENQSNLDATIKSYDIDAYINNVKIAKIQNGINQTIHPNGNSIIMVPINFNPTSVLKELFNIDILKGVVLDRSKVILTLKGFVSVVSSGVLNIDNFPVNYSEPLSKLVSG